ncbi:MAG: c-type cytochrome [Phycisphaera sp.]|nr:c-type cytochrome [Phycisphaera sp.]
MKLLPTVVACTLFAAFAAPLHADPLTLNKGDHISIIGNTLADRMQHDGWLETLVQARFPGLELSFRNLAFPADEVNLRPRSENFGTPDDWLTKTRADVVIAFFGFNESFRGEAGLGKFRSDLAAFIDHTAQQKYDDKGAPKLVLCSPIACEDLHDPNLPDGSANNARIALYAKAMAEVAKEKGVPFVDLFTPTMELYKKSSEPVTMNGVHLLEKGNHAVAEAIVAQLFPGVESKLNSEQTEKLRQAVLDKNYHWFNLYRTVDGYNVYGGRSKLNWHGQSNADVMSREMDIFSVMTANRQKRVWAVAQGGDMKVDDSNAPPLVKVETNRPGPGPDGSYPFLGGEEAIAKMKVAQGMQVNLFASEEKFPDLVNPVQMAVDTDSRLWIATWPSYPHWNPKDPREDKLIILEDTDGDGKADKETVFVDGLNSPTGFEFWGGGVLVAQAPEIWFLKDTDGDDKADVKIRVLQGVSSADSHHTCNGLTIGPDGGLYYSHGVFHVDNMETPTGPFHTNSQSGVYRFDPRTYQNEYVHPIGPNPHGQAFDQWGFHFATDGTTGVGDYVAIGHGVGSPKHFYTKRVRPVPASGILSSSHFPEANQGNFLVCNAIGFQGVLQHEFKYDGADITATEIEPIVVSSDPNFRPTDLEIGGDGALYISDWQNPLIGHMQHNIRDPNRDHTHGRIYRVTAVGRSLLEPVKMKGKPIDEVLTHFFAKENGTRYRARLELSGRDTKDVIAATAKFAGKLDIGKVENEQPLLECLWVFEEQRVPNRELLAKVLKATEPRVRAAAIRTLGHWGAKVDNWSELLLAGARDDNALVRAEAALAATSFEGLPAAEAIFEVATRPTDDQLDYVLAYARRQINVDQMVQDALKAGQPLSPAAQTYAVQKASLQTVLSMKHTELVLQALLSRDGVPLSTRHEALAEIAKMHGTKPAQELVAAIEREQVNPGGGIGDLLAMLRTSPAPDIKGELKPLIALAESTPSADTRRSIYAAWVMADGDGAAAWKHASKSVDTLGDLIRAIPMINNPNAVESLYPHLRSLMFELPGNLRDAGAGASAASTSAMQAAYFSPARGNAELKTYESLTPQSSGPAKQFRIDDAPIKSRDNFTLVFTGSVHTPKAGKYTFFINSDDGSRLYLDGKELINNDGLHGMVERGGDTQLAPGAHAITVVYFDNGGGDGLVVSWQGPGFGKQEIPAGAIGGVETKSIHDLAITITSQLRGHVDEKIDDYAKLITSDKSVDSALAALSVMPADAVAKRVTGDTRQAIAAKLIARSGETTLPQRETADFAAMMMLGQSLTEGDAAAAKQVADLLASVPTKIDPKVMALGREVFFRDGHCATCHQADGRGLPNQYPPLDGSPWVTGNEQRLTRVALHGLWGKLELFGDTYESPPLPPMTPFKDLLKDGELAAVLTFVRNSWSNRAKPIDTQTVTEVRAAVKDRSLFWKPEELLKLYPMEK